MASTGVNKVSLIGNLGNDPELRYTTANQAVATFRIATNESWTDREGQRQERTEWHRIVVWGRTAELANEYLRKGRRVYIEGRLQTREWDDREGNRRFTTEIVAQNVQFLDGGGEGGRRSGGYDEPPFPDADAYGPYGGAPARGPSEGAPRPRAAAPSAPAEPARGAETVDDDDIPF